MNKTFKRFENEEERKEYEQQRQLVRDMIKNMSDSLDRIIDNTTPKKKETHEDD